MLSNEELTKCLYSNYLRPFPLKLDEIGGLQTNWNCLKVIPIEQINITKEDSFNLMKFIKVKVINNE